MWDIWESNEYEKRRKRFQKERPRELRFVLGNFASLVSALNEGARSQQVRAGYIHPEPGGVLAITQQGCKNAVPLRLYVYPDDDSETLYVLSLGDKKSQSDDLRFCKHSLTTILSEGTTSHVQEEDVP